MATFATVTEIFGRAWVRQSDDSLTELHPGSVISLGSEVITASGASVTLAIDGASPISIGENRSVAITDDLVTTVDRSEAAVTLAEMTDSARLLAALEADDDPLAILDATAAIAGGPGGDDGGASFVSLARISEGILAPLNLSYANAVRTEADLPRLSGVGLADGTAAAPGTPIVAPPLATLPVTPPTTLPPPAANQPAEPPPGANQPGNPPLPRLQVLEDHTLTGNALNGATNEQGVAFSIAQFRVNGQTYDAGTTVNITDDSRPAKWQNVGTITIATDGEYTFIPSPDWNGVVPEIAYLMTDGTQINMDKLEIDVIPVNDQPSSLYEMFNASAPLGESYVFSPNDFPVRDNKDSDVNGQFFAPTEIIIDTLPPMGGALWLDGAPVTVGTRVSLADLQAGKLTYTVDADYNGGALLPFAFRVVDGGGTENGGVDTSQQYLFRLNVGRILTDSNFPSNEAINGGGGKDIIIGDEGGVTQRDIDDHADINIALLVDINAFTGERVAGGSQLTKADMLKNSLHALLNNELLAHAGKVNVSLITFDGANSVKQISITDLNADNIQTILDKIDGLAGLANKTADYTQAFHEAKAWFDQMAGNYGDYQNHTFFLTNSKSNGNPDDQAAAFNDLKQMSNVNAISIQYGNAFPNGGLAWNIPENRIIEHYDTNGSLRSVADPFRYTTHANFENSNGANNLSAWEVSGTGEGTVSITNGYLRMNLGPIVSPPQNRSLIVTQQEANKMVVTDPEGAYFSFRLPPEAATGSGTNFTDMFVWRLFKWDANANNGQGDWVVVEKGGDSLGNFAWNNEVITTAHHSAGDYRFQFEVAGTGLQPRSSITGVEDIRIHKPTTEGTPQFVRNPDELDAALSIHGTIVNSMGNDQIRTAQTGNKIVFGDSLNVDGLPWGQDGNPDKPTDKHGLDALKYFLEASFGHPPTHGEIFDYIWTNHGLFNVASDTHGGNDLLQGGESSNLFYGGGGNDTIHTGIGGNNIAYGGAGDDAFNLGWQGDNTVIGGPGNDKIYTSDVRHSNNTYVWLDGDAGTVALPAVDTISGGFYQDRSVRGASYSGHDVLDLRSLLQGEEHSKDNITGEYDLTDYLNVTFDGSKTVINVSSTGELQTSGFDQQIILINSDLTGGLSDQKQIINDLIQKGTLLVD